MQDGSDPDGPGPYRFSPPVLGVPTTFVTEDRRVMTAIREAYGHWAGYADPADAAAGGAPGGGPVVRIAVRSDAGGQAAGADVTHRLAGPMRLVVAGRGVAGKADAARGRSEAVVAPEIVADGDVLVRDIVEPLTLFLLGRRDRQPVHAAAIVRHGAAILLAGPSGAGKSTLTYAASGHGFSVLADEPVYVQLEPTLRVWGRRARVHLPPEAAARFPELRGRDPVRLPTGKTKLVVDLPDGPRSAERACLCVLGRSPDGVARLRGLEPAAAVAALTEHLDPGFDLFAETIPERIARVARGGAWRLALSDDPREALPLLDEVAAAMGGAP